MAGNDTEIALREWRSGQTQAERLCAAILHLEGFLDIDPQHPLGGPDGLKDVLCRKDGVRWVAAAYFPPTHPSFTEIKSKLEHDVQGVVRNDASGFVFFVNQPLTITERQTLQSTTGDARVEIYHLERLRAVLDSPKGCGVRLEYLRIAMTEEEQWSFWSTVNQDVVRRLAENETRQASKFQAIEEKLDLVLARTTAIGIDLQARSSSVIKPEQAESIELPTASISVATLCWLHRILTEGQGLPEAVRGRLRGVQVWIGKQGGDVKDAKYVPPAPDRVVLLLKQYVDWWRQEHPQLRGKSKPYIVSGLAEFHHRFLTIHPFLDANGRLARSLLDQASVELLNQVIGAAFISDASAYYAALRAADAGDRSQLEQRISASLI